MSMGFVKSAYIKENFGGNKMFKKLKNKKGFTLVELIEAYGKAEISTSTTKDDLTKYMDSIKKLAEIDGKSWTVAVTVSKTEGEVGQVKTLSLWDGSYGCVYSDGQYYVKSTDKVTVPTTNVTEEINWAA